MSEFKDRTKYYNKTMPTSYKNHNFLPTSGSTRNYKILLSMCETSVIKSSVSKTGHKKYE